MEFGNCLSCNLFIFIFFLPAKFFRKQIINCRHVISVQLSLSKFESLSMEQKARKRVPGCHCFLKIYFNTFYGDTGSYELMLIYSMNYDFFCSTIHGRRIIQKHKEVQNVTSTGKILNIFGMCIFSTCYT